MAKDQWGALAAASVLVCAVILYGAYWFGGVNADLRHKKAAMAAEEKAEDELTWYQQWRRDVVSPSGVKWEVRYEELAKEHYGKFQDLRDWQEAEVGRIARSLADAPASWKFEGDEKLVYQAGTAEEIKLEYVSEQKGYWRGSSWYIVSPFKLQIGGEKFKQAVEHWKLGRLSSMLGPRVKED